jgi:ATP-dependent helicase HrpA
VLPITARREELLTAIRDHQVVVVAGETGRARAPSCPSCASSSGVVSTGSSATPSLDVSPRAPSPSASPRSSAPRSAATSGYSVRFDDRVRTGTLVRVMTDGILLAELQRDRDLRRYDTLIIDEAHERSLNIDFILGYVASCCLAGPTSR